MCIRDRYQRRVRGRFTLLNGGTMSGRFGRQASGDDDGYRGRSYGGSFNDSAPGARRGPSKAEVNASLERARTQLGEDSSDEAYGENPYGADYGEAEPAPYTRDRDDSLDEMVHVGDFDFEPTEISPRGRQQDIRPSPRGGGLPTRAGYQRSEDPQTRPSPRGFERSEPETSEPRGSSREPREIPDRASPRAFDRPSARPEPRASPRGYERPEPQTRPSPRGYERPEPRAEPRASPRGYERPEPQTRPSPRGYERPEPRAEPRASPRGYERPERAEPRASPRGNDRPDPQTRPSPRGYERPEPRAEPRASPRGYERPERAEPRASPRGSGQEKRRASFGGEDSPRGEAKASPRGLDRPATRGEPRASPRSQDRPSPRGGDRPSPRAQERPSPRADDRPSPRAALEEEDSDDYRQEDFDSVTGGAMGTVPFEAPPPAGKDRRIVDDDNYLMFGVKHMQLKKDAHTYVEPHLLISVVDKKGRLIEAVQRTPDAQVEGQMLIFDYVVSVETNIATLVDRGGAVFFELRHWKLKDELNLTSVSHEEGRHSVKAYSYINAHEIKHMACRLPIYKSTKPTDFRRCFKPAPLSLTQDLFTHVDVITGAKEDLMHNWGYISPRPAITSPAVINLFFDSIGLKDGHSRDLGHGSGYVNPRMAVTVVDSKGGRIDKTYQTGEARDKKFQQIIFGQDIAIPLHVQDLADLGACFFFEFVHWKAHKAIDSVKCYSYMPVSEMRNGRFKLPVYKCEKPTDMTRRFKPATQSIIDKDLWLRLEVFCEAFVNEDAGLPADNAIDYSVNEVADDYEGVNERERKYHEDDGVAYSGDQGYDPDQVYDQGYDDDYQGSSYRNDTYAPAQDIDADGLVQYADPHSRNVDI
eukprot:TRINITY_DN6663_c0_g2_i1.p1 TRINITY_DN6663_c0_g2~~TRINITY_DN6663_c0_g2_i1.p1  ORF type:complete len:871 (-),score=127.17 TRINITY_DN6663_c0_g2_i1:164-2776(-)